MTLKDGKMFIKPSFNFQIGFVNKKLVLIIVFQTTHVKLDKVCFPRKKVEFRFILVRSSKMYVTHKIAFFDQSSTHAILSCLFNSTPSNAIT